MLQYFFHIAILSGRHAKSSSRRGNVANESHHCFRGKQMKSCELLESYWAQSWVVWTLDSTLRTLWAWIRQSNHRLRLFIWFQTNNAANIPQGIFVPMYWSPFPVKSNIAYSRLCNSPLERPVPDSNQPLIRRISFCIGLWLFQFQTLLPVGRAKKKSFNSLNTMQGHSWTNPDDQRMLQALQNKLDTAYPHPIMWQVSVWYLKPVERKPRVSLFFCLLYHYVDF